MSFKGRSAARVLLPFGLDHADVLSQGQQTVGPSIDLPIHGSLSPSEEAASKQSLALAKLLYDGPFYTGTPENSNVKKESTSIERYSDRYKKTKKVTRSIDDYPYQLALFPEELYSVMGISNKKKKLLLSNFKAGGALAQLDVGGSEESADAILARLKSLAEDLDANPSGKQEAEEEIDEFEDDDEFEEEDDDDYNAEKYFDDGDDEVGDDGDDEAAF